MVLDGAVFQLDLVMKPTLLLTLRNPLHTSTLRFGCILSGCLLAASLSGQGLLVQFQNRTGTGELGGSPVTIGMPGTVVNWANMIVGLYYGPPSASEDSLVRSSSLAVFRGPGVGFFDGGQISLPFAPIKLQVRVWDYSRYSTWEAAEADCGLVGRSQSFILQVPPFLPPGGLMGLRSFGLFTCDFIRTSLSFEGDHLSVCWTSVSNASYRVDYCNDLGGREWIPLVNDVVATNGWTCVTDALPSEGRLRMYRVVRPAPHAVAPAGLSESGSATVSTAGKPKRGGRKK
jgi:hypothetical protein